MHAGIRVRGMVLLVEKTAKKRLVEVRICAVRVPPIGLIHAT